MPNSEVAWLHVLDNSKILFLTLKFREKHFGTFLILKNAWDIWPPITTIFTLFDLVTIFKITIHEFTHPPENNSTYLLLHRQAEQAGYTYCAISLNFTLQEKYKNYFFTFNSYFFLRLCFVVQ